MAKVRPVDDNSCHVKNKVKRLKPRPLAPSGGNAAFRRLPSRALVLLVDADGLASAVPLVVIEQSAVLGACHMMMSVRLHRRSWKNMKD